MQSITLSTFSTLASNEFLQNFQLLCATGLDSTRIVKNVALVIRKLKFVLDGVLASLVPHLVATKEKYHCH